MTYAVDTRPPAERELQRLWRTSINPLIVHAAAERIKRKLAASPWSVGVGFGPGRMATYESPLAAVYRIDDQKGVVTIVEFWLIDDDTN